LLGALMFPSTFVCLHSTTFREEQDMAGKEKIGFIGLGMLGTPMAINLIKNGCELSVYNRSPEKNAPLADLGAEIVTQPWKVAQPGGVVMSCVSDDEALNAVVGNDDELARRLGDGGIHVSMSTILPETARRLADRQGQFGGHYVAAPVMGRPDAVAAGKQSYFIAGDPSAKARLRPLLEAISLKVFDFGENPDAANTAKLAANFMIASAIETMAEAFAFTAKNGADPTKLLEAAGSTFLACPVYQNYGRQILEKTYTEPLFKLALGLKDVKLISQTATKSQTPMRFARVLEDRFLAAMAAGHEGYDWTGIAAEVNREAGLP
jgi:3-hydroxyisobutyrate dehydrogenase-like beta-hydroxyacid dehydrogenase